MLHDRIRLFEQVVGIEGNFEPDVGWVVARMYEMHDHIVETFHEHVVTEDAVTVWKQ